MIVAGDGHGQRVQKRTSHALGEQHLAVVVQGKARRRLGPHEQTLAAASAGFFCVFNAITPICLHGDLMSTCMGGRISGRKGLGLFRGDAEGGDGGSLPFQHLPFDHPQIAFRLGFTGRQGPLDHVLFRGGQSRPPARGRNRVPVAERADQQPNGRDDPQQHQQRCRQVDRPCQAGLASCHIHQRDSLCAL